eukprot:TRINITY_DN6387_c0_g1_i1.p2 TRINITY_DN6387_c0_g1~~TRINITY_DN6387_c0_g1_i1.p2  ORF type:complete len:108 (-),score=8.67 TRINITY_DN6387_c0_g1_i1:53-376(-)
MCLYSDMSLHRVEGGAMVPALTPRHRSRSSSSLQGATAVSAAQRSMLGVNVACTYVGCWLHVQCIRFAISPGLCNGLHLFKKKKKKKKEKREKKKRKKKKQEKRSKQ